MEKKDYHLLFSLVLIELVEQIRENKLETINKSLVEFVEFADEYIDTLYAFFGNQKSKYELVETVIPHKDLENKDIHLWIDECLYESMKSKHSKYNSYSIAQFVRRCIYFVLLGLEKYGTLEEFRRILEELKHRYGENLARETCAKSAMVTNYLEIIRQSEAPRIFEVWVIAEFIKNLDLLL